MKVQPEYVEKPLRKLRQQVKAFPSNPRPEDVHSLRMQTRRLEAIVAALALEREKKPRRLLKLITPVRRAAGKVRDMDVLIGDVLALSPHQGEESAVALVEYMSRMRVKSARKLQRVVSGERAELCRRMKQSSKLITRKLRDDPTSRDGDAAPRILITELGHWPNLDESNLHLFRIRIKELRYMLQLTDQADKKPVDDLGALKDAIGEWHDRVELLKIAEKALDASYGGDLLKLIERTRDEKLHFALAAANRIRERYFGAQGGRETQSWKKRPELK